MTSDIEESLVDYFKGKVLVKAIIAKHYLTFVR